MNKPIVVKHFTGGVIPKKIIYIRDMNNIFNEIEEIVNMHIERNRNMIGHDLNITKILLPSLIYRLGVNVPSHIANIPIYQNIFEDENMESIILLNDIFYRNHFGVNTEIINAF